MQSLAAKVSNHRASRSGSPLQPVEDPGSTLGASPTPRLSTLAPAAALSLPSLAGVLSSYEHYDGDARLFAFLRRLAELGIASTAPAEIERLRTSPLAYVQSSLDSWITAQGGDTIDGNIEYFLDISVTQDGQLRGADTQQPLLITVAAEQCGYMVAGPALAALQSEAKGLGVAFYRVLSTSLAKWVRVYDYTDARNCEDGMKQMREMDDEQIRERYEIPDVEAAIPAFLRKARLKVARSDLPLLRKHQGGKFGGWIHRLLEIHRLAQLPAAGDVREIMSSYYDQSCLPSLLVVFNKNDTIEGCFDDEAQCWPEASSEPCLAVAFDPADAGQTAAAMRSLETFLHLNRELCLLTEEFNKLAKAPEAR
jgi:hypothetical protein